MFGSIRSRLTGTYVVLILFTILVLGATTYFAQEEFFVETLKENLSHILPAIEGHAEPFFSGSITRQELQETLSRIAQQSKIRITVITAAGEVVADSGAEPESMENHATRPEMAAALHGNLLLPSGSAKPLAKTCSIQLCRLLGRTGSKVSFELPFQWKGWTKA